LIKSVLQNKNNAIKNFLIIFSLLLVQDIFGQTGKQHKVLLSITSKFTVDSIKFYDPPVKLGLLKDTGFFIEQIKTPEKAIQAFISFDKYEWGKSLAGNTYKNFPFPERVKYKATTEYRRNAFAKIYFVLYFNYNDNPYSLCYINTYLDDNQKNAFQAIIYEYKGDKWLLFTDWFTSRLGDIEKIKPEYVMNLLQGKPIKGNSKYNELLNSAYNNGVLDMGVLLFLLDKKKEYFIELLNQ